MRAVNGLLHSSHRYEFWHDKKAKNVLTHVMWDSGGSLDVLWGFPQIMRIVKIRQMVVFI